MEPIETALNRLSDEIKCTRDDVAHLKDAIVGEPSGERLGIIGRVTIVERDINDHRLACDAKAGRQQAAIYTGLVAMALSVWNWISSHQSVK